jgi:hypothetical protein
MFASQIPAVPESKTLPVLAQVREAWGNKPAFILGAIGGGIAPIIAFTLLHFAVKADAPLYSQVLAYIGTGALAFSATTVNEWFSEAFGNKVKAVGLTLAIEGTMTFAPENLFWFSVGMLALLIAINAAATGSMLALKDNAYKAHRSEVEAREESERLARVKAILDASKPARAARKATPKPVPTPEVPAVVAAPQKPKRVRKPRAVKAPAPVADFPTLGESQPAVA